MKINIFIAGAKELVAHRRALKEVASDLTAEYDTKGVNVSVNMCSYENFGEVQNDYNHFIEQKADIFLLVVDRKIGKRTEDEFLHAVRTNREIGRPEIHAFVKIFDPESASHETGYIEGFLNGALEKYYINYNSPEDIAQKAKERIRDYIDDQIRHPRSNKRKQRSVRVVKNTPMNTPAPQSNPAQPSGGKRKGWMVGVLVTLLLTIVAMALVWSRQAKEHKVAKASQEITTLFIGGGSASNHMRMNPTQNCQEGKASCIDIRDLENAMYVNMPSGVSYSLITEDIVEPHYKRDKGLRSQKYYPIAISAAKAEDKNFLEIYSDVNELKAQGRIISFEYGNDTLAVYLHKDILDKGLFTLADQSQRGISTKELATLIKELAPVNKAKVYHTSTNSGTYKTYQTKLGLFDCTIAKYDTNDNVYTDKTNVANIYGKDHAPFVILGSNAYTVDKLNDTCYKLYIYEEEPKSGNYEYLYKTIHIYFPAYDTDSEALYIPDNMIKLLEMMGQDTDKIENNHLYRTIDNLVLDFHEDIVYTPNNTK